MNKLFNNIITLGKSFYGLIIYFSVAYIFSYIINSIPDMNSNLYNIFLILEELTTLLLLVIVFRKRLKKDFIDFDKNYKKYLYLGFKVWLIGVIVMMISNNIIYYFATNSIANNQSINMSVMNKYPLYSLIAMVMAGPFIEEIVFRLSFKNVLKNKALYYILSVLIFTSLHVFNGITSPIELLYFIPYGALAVSFSYILDKTDNIYTTAIIHTCHNALSVVLITMSGLF